MGKLQNFPEIVSWFFPVYIIHKARVRGKNCLVNHTSSIFVLFPFWPPPIFLSKLGINSWVTWCRQVVKIMHFWKFPEKILDFSPNIFHLNIFYFPILTKNVPILNNNFGEKYRVFLNMFPWFSQLTQVYFLSWTSPSPLRA